MRVAHALAIVLAIGWMGCGSDSGTPSGSSGGGGRTNNPVMRSIAFVPNPDTVSVGAAVTWTNNDGFAHTVTSSPGSPGAAYDSGNIAGGGAFQHAFTAAGTYPYYCTIHGTPTSGMRGVIVVE